MSQNERRREKKNRLEITDFNARVKSPFYIHKSGNKKSHNSVSFSIIEIIQSEQM